MPYTTVSRVENGRSLLEYILQEKGHNENAVRNMMKSSVAMNDNEDYGTQMDRYWRRARSNHKVQIIHIIQSFSPKEFSRDNPDDVLKVNMIGQDFVSEHYKGRQALICTQADGKGKCLHNHILINDVSMINSKGCDNEEYHHKNVSEWSDKIVANYIIPIETKEADEKLTRTEILKREKEKYVYKDDIRKRVEKTMENVSSEKEFLEKLFDNGVVAKKKKRGTKDKEEYYLYELLDLSEVPEGTRLPKYNLTIKSYNLGAAYGPKAVNEAVKNYKPPKRWSGEKVVFTSGTSMNVPAPETVEKQEVEYAPEHKISMSAEEKTAEEIAVSAPVQQVEKLQEQQMVAPPPIVDDEDDDEEKSVQKKSAQKVEAAHKPKVEQKQRNLSNRFRNLPLSDVSEGVDKEKDDRDLGG
ncbi:MAG: relaxase/mobilization nuclease domain-containing protein [Oscillospiraceae bacterium]|nr:relaxase/mobilization nuclease domain-containing protein [Oscillospiraceae bacterium]